MPAPGTNVTVTTEVGYCPFCRRTRNLRREERHLGGLVRTTIECESCHRVLSSTMGQPPPTPAPPAVNVVVPAEQPQPEPATAAKEPAAARKTAPKKTAAKTAAKAKTTTSRTKTSTRKTKA